MDGLMNMCGHTCVYGKTPISVEFRVLNRRGFEDSSACSFVLLRNLR